MAKLVDSIAELGREIHFRQWAKCQFGTPFFYGFSPAITVPIDVVSHIGTAFIFFPINLVGATMQIGSGALNLLGTIGNEVHHRLWMKRHFG